MKKVGWMVTMQSRKTPYYYAFHLIYYIPLHPHSIYKTAVYFTTYKPCHLVTLISFMKAIQKYNSGYVGKNLLP